MSQVHLALEMGDKDQERGTSGTIFSTGGCRAQFIAGRSLWNIDAFWENCTYASWPWTKRSDRKVRHTVRAAGCFAVQLGRARVVNFPRIFARRRVLRKSDTFRFVEIQLSRDVSEPNRGVEMFDTMDESEVVLFGWAER